MPNPQSHTYLALTIGPIIKTLLEARKTRELWAASYLLSTLMKHLVDQLDPDSENVLIPKIPGSVLDKTLYGAGIYPDRLFMQADGWSAKQIDTCIELALRKLAEECLLESERATDKEKEALIDEAMKFWRPFFRIRYVLKELGDITGGNLSKRLTPYLENAELEDTCFPEEPETNELLKLFQEGRIYNTNLSNGLRGDNRGVYGPIMTSSSFFPSTAEIGAIELHTKVPGALFDIADKLREEKEEESETYFRRIEQHVELRKHFQLRHKYFCIVQADGDSVGKAIQQLKDEEGYREFSETLASFGADAADIINKYGGKPIYIGGDDLLFLAPVQNGAKTIFNLIQDLDEAFPKEKLHEDVSLSYGLNIAYYKFPLFEAIADAYAILSEAKQYKSKAGKRKNAVSFRFTKHSGSYFEATFSKSFLEKAIVAIDAFESFSPKGRKGLVSSLMYKVQTLESLLDGMALQKGTEVGDGLGLKGRLDHFFDSYFNEWEGETGFVEQREATGDLLLAAYREAGSGKDKWLSLFYATMRLIDFMSETSEQQQYDPENISSAVG